MDHAHDRKLPIQELPCRTPVYELFSRGVSHGSIVPGSSWILQVPSKDPWGKRSSLSCFCFASEKPRSKSCFQCRSHIIFDRLGCSRPHEVIASCQFGSPHKKEFVFLVYGIPTDGLEIKCPGGHEHIKIEGKFTRPSATYVEGLALHVARFFQRALMLKARTGDFAQLPGLESVLSNDVLLTSHWLSTLHPGASLYISTCLRPPWLSGCWNGKQGFSLIPGSWISSNYRSRGALTKGRSSSRLLLGFCRRATALQIIGGLYPVWPFSPTRLNVADDPTRGLSPRPPVPHSLRGFIGLDLSQLHAVSLSRPMANWVRLLVLVAMLQPSDALSVGLSFSGLAPLNPYLCGLSLVWFLSVISHLFACLLVALLFWVALAGWLVLALPRGTKVLGRAQLMLVLVLVVLCRPLHAMEPLNTAEAERATLRQGTNLIASRTVRPETRAGREKLLERFGTWLWTHHQVQLSVLLATKPADPEEICKWLVLFGQDCYASGKTYGSFSETINAVAAARPLIKRQLAPAWDLAFAWLCDEPHRHHPALPASVLLAMLSVALMWGWPLEAGILALTWNGILRIGETLMAQRKDLVLIKDSMPGINFILLRIKMPKTRGRSAKHQGTCRSHRHDSVDHGSVWASSPWCQAVAVFCFDLAEEIQQSFGSSWAEGWRPWWSSGFRSGFTSTRWGDSPSASYRRPGVDSQTWTMVVVPGHGNIPAGSDGYNLHSEAIANCQGQNFEACCSMCWHRPFRFCRVAYQQRYGHPYFKHELQRSLGKEGWVGWNSTICHLKGNWLHDRLPSLQWKMVGVQLAWM